MDGSVVKYSSTTYNWKELHAFLLSHAYRLIRHITPTSPKNKPMVFNPQSRKGWNNLCPRAVGGKCFVTFLDPHASNHDESLSTLQLLANHFPSLPVMWLDVTLLYPFKQQFKLKGHVYPQSVLYFRSKVLAFPYQEAFEFEDVKNFLEPLVEGDKEGWIGGITLVQDPSWTLPTRDNL
eukprot:TRINITY_DN3869_c0_g1_i13.p1 TRINITY_DN3869_c0_g1~~TRINITY_DN3869_c0_g1_i13.p1  ORF type:complete len:179 (+),score=27.05 TRINITY_DN3869_c0_g1_i13:213-749(+)